jgi:hypothetical protein
VRAKRGEGEFSLRTELSEELVNVFRRLVVHCGEDFEVVRCAVRESAHCAADILSRESLGDAAGLPVDKVVSGLVTEPPTSWPPKSPIGFGANA